MHQKNLSLTSNTKLPQTERHESVTFYPEKLDYFHDMVWAVESLDLSPIIFFPLKHKKDTIFKKYLRSVNPINRWMVLHYLHFNF